MSADNREYDGHQRRQRPSPVAIYVVGVLVGLVEQCGYNQIEPGVDIVLCGKAPFLMLAATSARTPGSTPVAVANAAAFVSLRLSLIKDLAIAFGWPKRCR